MEKETETAPERLTLRKSAKLRHKSLVDRVFSGRRNIYDFPLRLSWNMLDDEELAANFRDHVPDRLGPVQIMIVVPKKKRRRAVDRVRMRRLIREAYRLQQGPLRRAVESNPRIRTLSVAFIYLDTSGSDFATISRKMGSLLSRLEKKIERALSADDTPTVSDTPKES